MPHNLRHRPLPRKPDPEPARLRKRKRVTIIAAFQCSDGLLMCADSEQSVFGSDAKSQTQKIDAFKSAYASVAIGGSGDSGVIQYVQYEFMQRIARDRPKW